jgi:hypothetical protein
MDSTGNITFQIGTIMAYMGYIARRTVQVHPETFSGTRYNVFTSRIIHTWQDLPGLCHNSGIQSRNSQKNIVKISIAFLFVIL